MHEAIVDSIWMRQEDGPDVCQTGLERPQLHWRPYSWCGSDTSWLRITVGKMMYLNRSWVPRDIEYSFCETCADWNRLPLLVDPRSVEVVEEPDDNCERCNCMLVMAVPTKDGGFDLLCERCYNGIDHNCNDWFAYFARCGKCDCVFNYIPEDPDEFPSTYLCGKCNDEGHQCVEEGVEGE